MKNKKTNSTPIIRFARLGESISKTLLKIYGLNFILDCV